MGLFDRITVGAEPSMLHASAVTLRMAVRKLWADHVVWTRLYVIAATGGTPDGQAAAERLLRNQDDIGSAIVPYFGRDAGSQLTKLLKEHIGIAVKLVDAAKSHDTTKFAEEDARWTANADAIADFLSKANEHWPRKDVADLLHLHLSLTKSEVEARLQKDWNADVKAFDEILVEAMTIADALSDGIVRKFPQKFGA